MCRLAFHLTKLSWDHFYYFNTGLPFACDIRLDYVSEHPEVVRGGDGDTNHTPWLAVCHLRHILGHDICHS